MLASYIQALETRAKWIRWVPTQQVLGDNNYVHEIMPLYERCLKNGDSYFMDHHFCDLVNHARTTIPDDLQFEDPWMYTPSGFLIMEDAIETPKPVDLLKVLDLKRGWIRAVGWYYIPALKGYQFTVFTAFNDYIKGAEGFGCWSHFAIRQGDTILTKIREFEKKAMLEEVFAKARGAQDYSNLGGYYAQEPATDMMHEIRWIYAALHLMSQRLTHVGTHKTSSMARVLASKKRLQLLPSIKVVSLRRMHEDKPKNVSARDWKWQWQVAGHWRLQPYKTLGDYKWIFIESYIKGPTDKPIKPPQHKLYVAKR